jgi:hypothetical protein
VRCLNRRLAPNSGRRLNLTCPRALRGSTAVRRSASLGGRGAAGAAFPRGAWERGRWRGQTRSRPQLTCSHALRGRTAVRRSASLGGRGAAGAAFPRGAWERGVLSLRRYRELSNWPRGRPAALPDR